MQLLQLLPLSLLFITTVENDNKTLNAISMYLLASILCFIGALTSFGLLLKQDKFLFLYLSLTFSALFFISLVLNFI